MDLNVLWPAGTSPKIALQSVKKVLAVLVELGYKGAAINVVISKTKGTESPLTPALMAHLAEEFPSLWLLRRCTIVMSDGGSVSSLGRLASEFDLIAVEPPTDKALQSAATALDIDLISFDMGSRIPFHLKHKTACAAVERGVRFEICYSAATHSATTRRRCITNALAILRATRGRGVVASSGTTGAAGVRAPLDVANLLYVWGLPAQASRAAIKAEPLAAITNGKLRRCSAKQTVVVNHPEETQRKKLKLGE